MRALFLAGAWIAFYFLLARYGVYALPQEIAQRTTLPAYLAGVQVLSIAFGLVLARVLSKAGRPWGPLLFPLSPPGTVTSGRLLLWAVALAPVTYLGAHALGMYFAYDTLISELMQRGARAVQQQTGELGRSATQDTLWTIVPFTLLIAPLGEELIFRGALFGALQEQFERFGAPAEAPAIETASENEEAPESYGITGLTRKNAGPSLPEHLSLWTQRGGGAALVSGGIFGLLHADTPGGLGIVRLVSAMVLGVVCGLLRFKSGTLLAPLALHMVYNLVALGTMRGWLVTANYPTKYGIPTVLGPVSVACIVLLVVDQVLARRRFKSAK